MHLRHRERDRRSFGPHWQNEIVRMLEPWESSRSSKDAWASNRWRTRDQGTTRIVQGLNPNLRIRIEILETARAQSLGQARRTRANISRCSSRSIRGTGTIRASATIQETTLQRESLRQASKISVTKLRVIVTKLHKSTNLQTHFHYYLTRFCTWRKIVRNAVDTYQKNSRSFHGTFFW